MLRTRTSSMLRLTLVTGAAVATVVGAPTNVAAQALKDVRVADTPLVLKAQGSLLPGGVASAVGTHS